MTKQTESGPELFQEVGGVLGLAERVLILEIVSRADSFGAAARILGISHKTLCTKMRSYGFGPREKPEGAFDHDHVVFSEVLCGLHCIRCGCTQSNACIDENGEGCHWAQLSICSACCTPEEAAAADLPG